MLSLDSLRWGELTHAYGPASDTPALLRALESFPAHSRYDEEPWFTLWSSLCHQGDIYPASYAAVPHILRVAASAPERADYNFFLLPAAIEIARQPISPRAHPAPAIPEDLRGAYSAAWGGVPALVARCVERPWDDTFLRSATAALAAAKGHPGVAEALLDLEPDTMADFKRWLAER